MTIVASIQEHGDHVYITTPVQLYTPEQGEIDEFVFAADIRSAAPNPNILWLKGQYVEADAANRNADQWTAGELAIKALTPVLMPVTVMHDLRSAVGTIADARLLTPAAHQVPRSRIDSTLAIWGHRFPEVAEECQTNASQGTLMQSMECLSPYYDCSVCGKMIQRTRNWQKEWKAHLADHSSDVLSGERSAARILRNVTFTGVGLIFGSRGARGAYPDAHLEVGVLAELHREAHQSTCTKAKRQRRKGFMEIEDSKYEAMVSAKSEADNKVTALTAERDELNRKVETLEREKVAAEEARDTEKKRADDAEESQRVAAMKEDRLSKLGTGFVAKLDKHEHTAKVVRAQAAKLADDEWEARLVELEETLGVKRDVKLDDKAGGQGNGGEGEGNNGNGSDALAGTLFTREQVTTSRAGVSEEVTAAAGGGNQEEPTVTARQSVVGGLIRRPQQKQTAAAK